METHDRDHPEKTFSYQPQPDVPAADSGLRGVGDHVVESLDPSPRPAPCVAAATPGDCTRRGLSGTQVWRDIPRIQAPRAPVDLAARLPCPVERTTLVSSSSPDPVAPGAAARSRFASGLLAPQSSSPTSMKPVDTRRCSRSNEPEAGRRSVELTCAGSRRCAH